MEYVRIFNTANRYRTSFTGLPQWGRLVVAVFALPGIALLLLSITIFVVSLLALLLLTVPVYRMLVTLTSSRQARTETSSGSVFMPVTDGNRRRVDVRIVE